MRLLQALVGKAGRAAHQAAAEAMGGFSAVRVDGEFDEQTAAILVRAQAAPAVGQRLGQHRHDAVGEIDAVAAGARRVVERRSRADVMRDIGDGDDEAEAPGEPASSGSANTASSKSRASSPSMVTSGRWRRSVRRPSGVAPARLGFFQRGGRKFLRDVVGVDGDQADGPGIAHGAEPLDDAGRLQAQACVGQRFGEHDLALDRAAGRAWRHQPFRLGTAVGGDDAPALIDAEDAAGRVGDTPHGAALVAAGARRLQAHKHAFAGGQCRTAGWFGGHEDRWRRTVRAVPLGGPGDGVAIRVGAGDHDDGGLGQAHVRRPGAGPIDPAIHGVRQGWVTPCICGFGGRAASILSSRGPDVMQVLA